MKSLFALLMVLPALCFGQYTYNHLQVNFLETPAAVKDYTYLNLRLYPVYAKGSFRSQFKNLGHYMPLQEAVQKKKVKITEKPNGGTVNKLTIENISSDTVIIVCGDVIKGGQQDRIVEKDVLLKPKSGKQNLDVFCVESGRWSTRNEVFSSRGSKAPPEGAAFVQTYNKGAMSLRKVVEKDKDQTKVWSKVEEINKQNKTTTDTKTYTALNNSADFNKKLAAYIQFFKNKFAADTNVVGVVVATGNTVLGCDLFATPTLFKSQYQSLLHSYATEAILKGKPVTANAAVVKTYTNSLLKDEATQQKTLKQKGTAFVEKGKKLRVSSFD